MTDKPPSDAADHAEDFARRYAQDLDIATGSVMLGLGVEPERIGSSDHEYDIRHASFHPHRRDGGGITPAGQINLDSGLLNPDLFAHLGEDASRAYREARLRTRMEAAIAHEWEEYEGGNHSYAVEHAPETKLPIGESTRELLKIIRLAETATPPGDSIPPR